MLVVEEGEDTTACHALRREGGRDVRSRIRTTISWWEGL